MSLPSLDFFDFGNAAVLVVAAISWLNCFIPSLRLGPKKWPQLWALVLTVGPACQMLCLLNLFDIQAILVDAAWMMAFILLFSFLLRLISWSRKRIRRIRNPQGRTTPRITIEAEG